MRTATIMTTGALLFALACLAAAAVSRHWTDSVVQIIPPMEPVATRAMVEPVLQAWDTGSAMTA